MPIITGGFSGTVWNTWRRKAITIGGIISVVTGAIVGMSNAGPVVEPWWVYSRGGTRDLVKVSEQKASAELSAYAAQSKARDESNAKSLHHIQLELAQGKSEATDNDLFKAGLELKKATDDQTRQYIMEQVTKLQHTKNRIDNQIETLLKKSDP